MNRPLNPSALLPASGDKFQVSIVLPGVAQLKEKIEKSRELHTNYLPTTYSPNPSLHSRPPSQVVRFEGLTEVAVVNYDDNNKGNLSSAEAVILDVYVE